jgi:AcrR family transcriptional regulator
VGAGGSRGGARNRILDVATRLLYTDGLSVGVDTIVAQSGVAKATLYTHFPSKDLLVREVLERRDRAWRERVERAVERAGDPEARVLAVFDVLHEDVSTPDYRGSPHLNAVAELADPAHPARAACATHAAELRELLRRLAREAGAREPDEMAAALAMLVHGASCARAIEGDREAARRARRIAAILLDTEEGT